MAAAQALVRQQQQQQDTTKISEKQLRKQKNQQRQALVHSLTHWLSKDPSFFLATMNALNLTSSSSTISNSTLQQQHDNHHNQKNKNGRPNQDHHPIQIVLDQYRQLYYDSIPSFMELVSSYNNNNQNNNQKNKFRFDFDEEMQSLQTAGFGDPKWAKRYRKVRGHQVRENNLMRQTINAKVELERTKSSVRKAKAELVALQVELEQVQTKRMEQQQQQQQILQKRRQEEEEEEAKKKKTQQYKKKQEKEEIALTSLVWNRAWSVLSSIVGYNPQQTYEETTIKKSSTIHYDDPTIIDYNNNNNSNNNTNDFRRIPTTSRIEKRIGKKEWEIQQLQEYTQNATNKLTELQEQRKQWITPMSLEEYKKVNVIVDQVRSLVCEKLAQHIRQRHERLIQQFQTLDSKTDLTKPQEWYAYARLDRRKIIFHGGPTNSGKTYSALQRLRESKNGLYLGPLRLLAAEIYETLTIDGIYTNLFTGQERQEIPFSTHSSATVEMCSVDNEYDVVVMDEIQMIADTARGAAWTRALLGLRCKEIHVCGGWEAKGIVEKIAKSCGDDFEVHKYERFSKLDVAKNSLAQDPTKVGAYEHVQPGDCVVAFSRNDIFAIKREIETYTKYKCCVIYGKLPPQTRADQARRFNDPDSGYDILVASDAIGMGLNLNIRRIIFNSIFKFNGEAVVRLSHSDIKQISGRAGRRNSPFPNGQVTCRDPRDLPYIRKCLSTEIKPIEKAGLLPTAAHIELFSDALGVYDLDDDHTNLHQILRQFSAMATVKGDFFLCRQTEMRAIAKKLKDVPINLRDAYTMCLSPTTENSIRILENFAWKYSQGQVSGLPSRSVPKKAKSFDDLSYLCGLYSDADLFLWLQMKFPEYNNAVEHQAALARKETTLEFINEALANTESLKLNHNYIRQATRHRVVWEAEHGHEEVDDEDSTDNTNFVASSGYSEDEDEYSEEEQQAVYY